MSLIDPKEARTLHPTQGATWAQSPREQVQTLPIPTPLGYEGGGLDSPLMPATLGASLGINRGPG